MTIKKETAKLRLKALKSVGLLRDIPLNRKLSSQQINKIQSTFKKAKDVVLSPIGEYKAVPITTKSKFDRQALEQTGYPIVEGKLFVPLQGYNNAYLKIGDTSQSGAFKTEIVRTRTDQGEKKTEKDIYITGPKKMTEAERLELEYKELRLRDGEKAAVKTNGRRAWSKSFFTDLSDGMDMVFGYEKYIRARQKGGYDPTTTPLEAAHFVKVTFKDKSGKIRLQEGSRSKGFTELSDRKKASLAKSRQRKAKGLRTTRR